MCALSALTPASGHGFHLLKLDGLIIAYRVSCLFSRFYPQRVSAKIRTPGVDQVWSIVVVNEAALAKFANGFIYAKREKNVLAEPLFAHRSILKALLSLGDRHLRYIRQGAIQQFSSLFRVLAAQIQWRDHAQS